MALEIKIDAREIEGFAKAAEKMPAAATKAASAAMTEAVALLKGQIAVRTPVDTGRLRASITGQKTVRAKFLLGIVTTPIFYGLPVEWGHRVGNSGKRTEGVFMFQKGFDASLPHIDRIFDTVPAKILAVLE